MSTRQISRGGFQLSTMPLITGAALMGMGAMLAAAGLTVSGAALVKATRTWIRGMDVPPSEVMRSKWSQAKAATAAGASAWQNGLVTSGR
ncbi:MAG TPA: hypothetical protein VGI64_08200 [Streptosporangiaceae bacterium]|jgi:hypothetical protein